MDAQTRRAMREWTEQSTPLLPGPQRPAQVDGITEEDVHNEVRRQVAAALESRDIGRFETCSRKMGSSGSSFVL